MYDIQNVPSFTPVLQAAQRLDVVQGVPRVGTRDRCHSCRGELQRREGGWEEGRGQGAEQQKEVHLAMQYLIRTVAPRHAAAQ